MIVWVVRYFCYDSLPTWTHRNWIKGVYASKELAESAAADDPDCYDIVPFAVEGVSTEEPS